MSFQKGNKFASHDKPWTDALRRVLAQLEVKDDTGKVLVKAGEALRLIAEATVSQAIAGDKDARKEIADRLDGKASEFLNVHHSGDPRAMTSDELAAQILRERANSQSGGEEQPSTVH